MMSRNVVLVSLAVLLLGQVSSAEDLLPPDTSTNGADLMDRLSQTLGGAGAARLLENRYTLSTTNNDDSGLSVQIETWWGHPHSFYMVFHLADGGTREYGFDGVNGWARGPEGPRLLVPDEVAGLALDASPICLVAWREYFLAADLIGSEEVFGYLCDVVHLVPDRGRPRNVYINRSTGLPDKITMDRTIGRSTVAVAVFLSKFRATDNLVAPWQMLSAFDGTTEITRTDRIISNAPLPPGIFDLPDDISALVELEE